MLIAIGSRGLLAGGICQVYGAEVLHGRDYKGGSAANPASERGHKGGADSQGQAGWLSSLHYLGRLGGLRRREGGSSNKVSARLSFQTV